MPSFIVHSIAGREISKYLSLNKEEENLFFLGNLLPDAVNVDRNNNLSDNETRHVIQSQKRITHFRTSTDRVLQVPDLDYFLSKYKDYVSKDIVVFGYFFHLYTDYYYFSKFLPKMLTFLDKDYNEVFLRSENVYIKINKTNDILEKPLFWSKKNPNGIYGDYNRLNNYLVKKYNFSFDYDNYFEVFNSNKFNNIIIEANTDCMNKLLVELNNFYIESLKCKIDDFKIFNPSDVDLLIQDIITSFLEEYKDILYVR